MTKKFGGKTREIIFSINTRISQAKNDGKNRLEKVRKHVFFINTRLRDQKAVGKKGR